MRSIAFKKYLPLSSIAAFSLLGLTACGTFSTETQDGAPTYYKNVNHIPNPVVRPLKKSKYGNPSSYVVNGKRYFVLPSAKGYRQTGIASWYGTKFHGRLTSTRETYNLYAMTAASPILPLPCFVRVTNLNNHRSVIVKVNDRGPFEDQRIIDLSYAAAAKLDMLKHGTAPVQVVALTPGYTSSASTASPRYLVDHWKYRQATKQEDVFAQPKSGLLIQIGAYSDYSNAQRVKQKVENYVHYPVIIQKANVNKRTVYLVKIGPLKNQQQVSTVEHALGGISL